MKSNELFFPKIDGLFKKWGTNNTPGCSLGIIRNGEILYQKDYGLRNLVSNDNITSDTIFDIASVSKQFTAACIALLILKDKLSLDDSFTDYLPEVKLDSKIKIKHLIYHESGIKDFQYSLISLNYKWDTIQSFASEQLFEYITKLPQLDFPPGNQHNYSNTNYFLLGQIVEKVTGTSLTKFAERELFSPLGMNKTSFHEKFSEIKNTNKAIGYSPRDDGYIENISKTEILGPRGVFTSVGDLFLWDQNFYTKMVGGDEFVMLLEKPSREKIDGLSKNRWDVKGQNQGYAFGLLTDYYRESRIIRHGGDFAGYTSEMLRFPDEELTIIILTNCSNINPTTLAFRTADILLANEFKNQSPFTRNQFEQIAISKINALLGTYYNPEGNTLFTIHRKDKKLILENDWVKSELRAVSKDTFTAIEHTSLMLVRMKEQAINIETEYFTADIPKIVPLKLEAKQLGEYIGKYTNKKFKKEIQITTNEDKLSFNLECGKQIVKPIIQDIFVNGFLQLIFHRKNNKISYVSLNSNGSKDIRYEKE
ncbi:MAG: beta-lactamase family protein [Candidatus Heimdallarchaeota archaeon]|nr:beta-lactamase family protein [Candidatus Heimdallarchaeota archaeon]